MRSRFVFKRPDLARSIVSGLAGEALADYSSGLFLAAPRRTGKSTFLREDLMPACEERGWGVVYVDLWANKTADPAALIERAIMAKLQMHESRLEKLRKASGLTRVNLFKTVTLDFSEPRLPGGMTLADALLLLAAATERPVVLIVDEAQHAMNSEAGMNAMFGLKAARDAMNQGAGAHGLRLVFTGSNRDKLAHLVLNRQQPFFGASITSFPLLGEDFVEAFTADVNAKLADDNVFQVADVMAAFQCVGHRPELLMDIIQRVALELGAAPDLGHLIRSNAEAIQLSVWAEYESAYQALTPLQKAVLEEIATCQIERTAFAPYADATLKRLAELMKRLGLEEPQPTPQNVQAAIASLRAKELIWRSGRGSYALEDSGLGEWLFALHRKQA